MYGFHLMMDIFKKEDFSYIKEQNMDCLAVSQYADGWYLDLPFVDVFDLYNPSDIKKNYLERC